MTLDVSPKSALWELSEAACDTEVINWLLT